MMTWYDAILAQVVCVPKHTHNIVLLISHIVHPPPLCPGPFLVFVVIVKHTTLPPGRGGVQDMFANRSTA
jgi:hypothetical protein